MYLLHKSEYFDEEFTQIMVARFIFIYISSGHGGMLLHGCPHLEVCIKASTG